MAEYSRIARGSFTTAGTPIAQVVNLPFQPQRVELECVSSFSSPSQYATTKAFWDISMGQGVAVQEYISSSAFPWNTAADNVESGGISTFAAGISLQYGSQIQIASIAKNSPTTVTTAVPHGLSTGQVVILEGLYQTPTTGMPQMSLIPFVITVTGATTFTVLWNSNQSNYTALTGSPVGAYVRQILYPWLYLPGTNVITSMTLSNVTTVLTTTHHNYVVGQQIAFRIPVGFGPTQLNSLPNNVVPGSPVYATVISIPSNDTFVCNINSSGFPSFTNNAPVSSVPGLQIPQVVAVGDLNSGGFPYSGGALYPSPAFPTFSGGIPTINGPAIMGAFVNNTSSGFIVGLGVGAEAADASASAPLLASNSDYVWTAYLYDLSM